MAKYIGTYANSGDVQTALNEQELNRPFIAYTTDNGKVIFGAAAGGAEAGDIVVYSVADDLLHYIPQANYNTTNYPTASYVPVGVVAYPQDDDIFSGASGDITFLALNWADGRFPDSGASYSAGIGNVDALRWGLSNVDISGLTNYATSGAAIEDLDGKANTEAVLAYAYASGITGWTTAATIPTNPSENDPFPIFEASWRYHTIGTVQGDWYVPAAGQYYKMLSNETIQMAVNSGLTLVGATAIDFTNRNTTGLSTEQSTSQLWRIEDGLVKSDSKQYSNTRLKPWCSSLMTRI